MTEHETSFVPSRGRGFTLVEMMVVIALALVTAMLVLPNLGDVERPRLIAASRVLISDLEFAQVMTISHPEQPVAVRFNPATSTYWLAAEQTPNVPLVRPDTGTDYLVRMGLDRALGAAGVAFTVEGMNDDTLVFDLQGGLKNQMQTPRIVLEMGARRWEVEVSPTTGSITEVEQTPGP